MTFVEAKRFLWYRGWSHKPHKAYPYLFCYLNRSHLSHAFHTEQDVIDFVEDIQHEPLHNYASIKEKLNAPLPVVQAAPVTVPPIPDSPPAPVEHGPVGMHNERVRARAC